MIHKLAALAFVAFILMAFTADQEEIKFSYPMSKDAVFYMSTDYFPKFSKEWQGQDYYYSCEKGKNDITCSVLFYKLVGQEKEQLVDMPSILLKGPKSSPLYPQTYFTAYSNLKKYESGNSKWGEITDDFMFSHAHIKTFNGVNVNQKHMYGYTMFGNDLFVNIHLSKTGCTPEDSIAMRKILDGLRK